MPGKTSGCWIFLFVVGGSPLGGLGWAFSCGHCNSKACEKCVHPWLSDKKGAFQSKSLSFPPTPPMGFVLIPPHGVLLSHLLGILYIMYCVCVWESVWVCMCMCVSTGPQGCTMAPPLKLFLCSKFAPALRRYSQWKFLPRSLVNVCSTGLITTQQGRALLPARSAISRLRGTIPFFKTRGFLFFFSFFRKHERRSLLRIRRLQRVFFFFFSGLEKFEMNDAWFGMLGVIQE